MPRRKKLNLAKKEPLNLQSMIGKGYNTIWEDRSFWLVVKGSRRCF
jgi:hypothetical protein